MGKTVFEALSYALFRELERLDAAEGADEIGDEVERARATAEIAKASIANINAMVSAADYLAGTGQFMRLPASMVGNVDVGE